MSVYRAAWLVGSVAIGSAVWRLLRTARSTTHEVARTAAATSATMVQAHAVLQDSHSRILPDLCGVMVAVQRGVASAEHELELTMGALRDLSARAHQVLDHVELVKVRKRIKYVLKLPFACCCSPHAR